MARQHDRSAARHHESSKAAPQQGSDARSAQKTPVLLPITAPENGMQTKKRGNTLAESGRSSCHHDKKGRSQGCDDIL
jgi:hypothetical protein